MWAFGGVVTASLGFFFVDLLLRVPRAQALRLVFSGLVYVGGALGLEALGHAYARTHGYWTWGYVTLAAFEEMGEMSGVLLFLHATLGDGSDGPRP